MVTLVGAAGTGKTTIASNLRAQCEREGRRVLWVSGEASLPATTRATLAEQVPQFGRGTTADLVVVDGFERISGIAAWFFQELLPTAGTRLLVLITSRERLGARIRSNLGLQKLLHGMELSAFATNEAKQLLDAANVPEDDHDTIIQFTGGLPLALALVIESYQLDDAYRFNVTAPGEVVDVLMQELLRDVDDTSLREAIDALCIVPYTDQELLQHMLGEEQGLAAFAVLRKLSFVRQEDQRLKPHDWARSAAYSDLSARRPNELTRLAQRAIALLVDRASTAEPAQMRELILQALMSRRDRPEVRALGLTIVDETTLRRAEEVDDPIIEAAIAQYESEDAVESFRRMRRMYPEGFFVVSDIAGNVVGVIGHVPVTDDPDPLMRVTYELAKDLPEEGHHGVSVFRWFFALEGYMQPSPAIGAVMLSGPLVTASSTPIPRYAFFMVPPSWGAQAHRMMVTPIDREPTQAFDRPYAPFLLDLASYVSEWTPAEVMSASLNTMVQRLLEPVAGLDRATFEAAVKDAMAALHQPAALERTALVRARSVSEPRDAAAIAAYLRSGVNAMAERPRQSDWADVLNATYVEPAVKQRAAATDLGIPFGTYRYRLRRALATLADELWRLESKAR